MRKYYAVANLEERRPGTYVSAENLTAAFEAATFKYQARHPRLHVETIAVQEIADDEYADTSGTQTDNQTWKRMM